MKKRIVVELRPEEEILRREARILAIRQGKGLTEVIIELLKKWLKEQKDLTK